MEPKMFLTGPIFQSIPFFESMGSGDIRNIKGPIVKGWSSPSIIILGLVLILLVGLLLFYNIRLKKKDKTLSLRPAHEIACEALKELIKKELIQERRLEEYYSELSNIIKCYLERRFDYKTSETTTEELLMKLRDSEELSQEQKNLLKIFFTHCDLIKFAGYRPSPEEITWSLKTGHEIIEQTTLPSPLPLEEEGGVRG